MGMFGAIWGVAGILMLIGFAVLRLTTPTMAAFSYQLAWYHWAILVLNLLFAGYVKGFRGFQKGLAPRIASRASLLKEDPSFWRVLLGPLYCMGYFSIGRKQQGVTIMMTVGMVMLILLFRLLPQPWRGLLDAGILIALTWGFIATLAQSTYVLAGRVWQPRRFEV